MTKQDNPSPGNQDFIVVSLVNLHDRGHDFLMENTGRTIVFYDGDCGLCQRSIAFLIKADTHHKLQFAPLNGQTYQTIYSEPACMDTVRVFNEGRTFEKSRAFFELGKVLGGKWRATSFLFKIFPAFISDAVYDQIASRRKTFKCLLLPKDNRFLP